MIRPSLEMGGVLGIGLAGAASVELLDGVVQLRPQEAMVEAMLRGWRAQQSARGLRRQRSIRGTAGAPVRVVHERVPVAVGSGARGRVDVGADQRGPLAPSRFAAIRPIFGCSAST